MNIRISVMLSIKRAIALWTYDINDARFHVKHDENNIMAMEKNLIALQRASGNSPFISRKVDYINQKINVYRSDIDRQNDIISQISQHIYNLNEIIHSLKSGPVHNVNINKMETINAAIKLFREQITKATGAQAQNYLNRLKNRADTDNNPDVDADYKQIIDTFTQDIENLEQLTGYYMNEYSRQNTR